MDDLENKAENQIEYLYQEEDYARWYYAWRRRRIISVIILGDCGNCCFGIFCV